MGLIHHYSLHHLVLSQVHTSSSLLVKFKDLLLFLAQLQMGLILHYSLHHLVLSQVHTSSDLQLKFKGLLPLLAQWRMDLILHCFLLLISIQVHIFSNLPVKFQNQTLLAQLHKGPIHRCSLPLPLISIQVRISSDLLVKYQV
jgi:hypothetical protein